MAVPIDRQTVINIILELNFLHTFDGGGGGGELAKCFLGISHILECVMGKIHLKKLIFGISSLVIFYIKKQGKFNYRLHCLKV